MTAALLALRSAPVLHRIAVDPVAGRKSLRLQAPGAASSAALGPEALTAERDGFSLEVAVACKATEGSKLDRLCRCIARPVLSLERSRVDGDGPEVRELERPCGYSLSGIPRAAPVRAGLGTTLA